MAALAQAGFSVGASLMPIIPFAGDDQRHLEETIRALKDHSGSFVMAGGLTMDGVQAEHMLAAALPLDPDLAQRWRKLYRWSTEKGPAYGPSPAYNAHLGLLVRTLCGRDGLLDRMLRFIAPGPLAINKRVAEKLFLKAYELELEQAGSYRTWAYRKAARTVDELPENLGDLFRAEGLDGLHKLPDIGEALARFVAVLLAEEGFS